MHLTELIPWLSASLYIFVLGVVAVPNIAVFSALTFSVVDPTWIVVVSTTFTLTLLIYVTFVYQIIELADFTFVIAGYALFLFTAVVIRFLILPNRRAAASGAYRSAPHLAVGERRFLSVYLPVATTALFGVLTLRSYFVGIPILDVDPEMAKVMVNRGGFGILTRLMEPLIGLNLVFLFYIRRMNGHFPKFGWVYLLVPMLALLSTGSKGALFIAYIAFYVANAFVSLRYRRSLNFVSPILVVLIAIGVLSYSALVLTLRAQGSNVEGVAQFVFETLMLRFIAFGDGPYYFFANQLRPVLAQSPTDFVYYYLVVPFLGPLRLAQYNMSLGEQIAYTLFGIRNLGPNPSMYVEGSTYFGQAFGLFYFMFLGGLFAVCKYLPLRLRLKSPIWILFLFFLGNIACLKIPFDMLLFAADLFNYVVTFTIFGSSSWVISQIIYGLPQEQRTVPSSDRLGSV